MAEKLEIKLKTLTPLWTGGVQAGQMDRIHETGIIGSLRWWYEAIVRGLGGDVCDPSQHRCRLDSEKYERGKKQGKIGSELLAYAGLCPGCQLLGATGWRRQFRLIVIDHTNELKQPRGPKSPSGDRFKKNGRDRPKWFFSGGHGGSFHLVITPLSKNFNPKILEGVLRLIEIQGGLAAKTQLGSGVIVLEDMTDFDPRKFVDSLEFTNTEDSKRSHNLPSITNMFFAQIATQDQGLTATLNLRYDIRAAFRQAFSGNQRLRHFVCGYVRGQERQGSKIFCSQAINGILRVWGWIPEEIPLQNASRDGVVSEIYRAVNSYGQLQIWREFNSKRDTINQYTDAHQFLISLLSE